MPIILDSSGKNTASVMNSFWMSTARRTRAEHVEAVDQPPFLFALFSNEVAEISPSGWPWSVGHIQQFGQRPSGPPEGAWENLGDCQG